MDTMTQDDYKELLRRYDSVTHATIKQQEVITNLQSELKLSQALNARLGAELEASQAHVQLLGDSFNERYQEANKEVGRLRTILKEHGISPEAN